MLPFLPEPAAENANTWTTFLGRFHILLLHFPVVLVLALTGLEFGSRVWPKIDTGKLLPLLWAAALGSCLITVVAGYLLYFSGEYRGDLVRNHLWGGVLLTFLLSGAALLRYNRPADQFNWRGRTYLSLLGLAAGLVIYTSHQGGSITHGPDFLSEYAPSLQAEQPSAVEQKPKEELLVFQDLIMPALDNRCLSCHNQYKTKGDLLMTSFAELSRGGKSGKPMLVAGQPGASEFYTRISLPLDDDDHMPPQEKPGLTDDETALIKWWIEQGADPEMTLGSGSDDPENQAMIDRYLPTLFRAQRLKVRREEELEAVQAELEELGQQLGLIIEPDREMPGYFAVSLSFPPQPVNDETITQLLPYAEIFSKISLPGALITDDGLYELAKMPKLQQLYLPKTCIKGTGLVYLQSLPALRELNLSYTFLNDAGVLNLLHLPQLETVYLFGTEVEAEILAALRTNLPDMEITETEGAYF